MNTIERRSGRYDPPPHTNRTETLMHQHTSLSGSADHRGLWRTTAVSDASAGRLAVGSSLQMRLAMLATILLPFAGLILAMVLLWHVAFSWVYLAVLLGMYMLTAIGVTVGFHRLFTHSAFKAPRWVVFTLGVLGSMSVQGPILVWAAVHRQHHHHSDDDGDPHSPHLHGDSVLGALRGFWHAHMGWMFDDHPADMDRYIPDLRRDALLCMVNRYFPLWALLGLLLPAILGGVLT